MKITNLSNFSSNTFPQTYQFNDLFSGIFYKVSGYLDLDGNGHYDPGEIYAEWIGQPSRNTLNAHLVMKDVAPVIEFFDGYGDNIEAVRGKKFLFRSVHLIIQMTIGHRLY